MGVGRPAKGLPQAYSGHNEVWVSGPPPNRYTSVIVVGQETASHMQRNFTGCRVLAHINDEVGVGNQKQGAPVWFGAGQRAVV